MAAHTCGSIRCRWGDSPAAAAAAIAFDEGVQVPSLLLLVTTPALCATAAPAPGLRSLHANGTHECLFLLPQACMCAFRHHEHGPCQMLKRAPSVPVFPCSSLPCSSLTPAPSPACSSPLCLTCFFSCLLLLPPAGHAQGQGTQPCTPAAWLGQGRQPRRLEGGGRGARHRRRQYRQPHPPGLAPRWARGGGQGGGQEGGNSACRRHPWLRRHSNSSSSSTDSRRRRSGRSSRCGAASSSRGGCLCSACVTCRAVCCGGHQPQGW